MKRLVLTLVVAFALVASLYAVLLGRAPAPRLRTVAVTSGDVVHAVVADGALQAVDTVQVGAQVTGTVIEVDADFDSVVHKGQVLARFDPNPARDEIEQARGAIGQARANLENAQAVVGDASYKLDQARKLAAESEITQEDLEAAQVAYREAVDGVKAQQAAIDQDTATLEQAQLDLEHTVITSPIDGVVISRDVEPGETVAARLETPLLFEIASDLRKMQAVVSVDESDVGTVKEGQPVTFTVEAYPARTFTGVVEQVRDGADTSDNEVTYSTVIRVDNDDLSLRPGMTATARIEVARRRNTLRVPRNALNLAPAPSVFKALGQAVPRNLDALSQPPRGLENVAATVWVWEGGHLRPEAVHTGLSDGETVELVSGNVKTGTTVVTDVM
jgi:HlyD family secretion protein